jgi:hypothetical protein
MDRRTFFRRRKDGCASRLHIRKRKIKLRMDGSKPGGFRLLSSSVRGLSFRWRYLRGQIGA